MQNGMYRLLSLWFKDNEEKHVHLYMITYAKKISSIYKEIIQMPLSYWKEQEKLDRWRQEREIEP